MLNCVSMTMSLCVFWILENYELAATTYLYQVFWAQASNYEGNYDGMQTAASWRSLVFKSASSSSIQREFHFPANTFFFIFCRILRCRLLLSYYQVCQPAASPPLYSRCVPQSIPGGEFWCPRCVI